MLLIDSIMKPTDRPFFAGGKKKPLKQPKKEKKELDEVQFCMLRIERQIRSNT